MNKLLKLNPIDEVAVALQDIKAGEQLEVEGQVLTAKYDISHGHKIALTAIAKGQPVVKYGFPIGKATADIAVGEHVHIHNMHTNMSDHDQYEYHPDVRPLTPVAPETFRGYVRKDGRAAVRNEVWIIPGVGCVADLSERLARENQGLVEKYGLDGLYAFPHPFGCSQIGEDNEMTRRLLATLVNHPNAGGVLVVSLGCENNVPKDFQKAIMDIAGDSWDPDRVKFMICQDVEDEIAEGGRLLEQAAQYASQFHREAVSVLKLVLGMKCGGSDGLSGITANPVLGALGDMLVARGGSSMITEVPEMFGAENLLMNRCVNRDVFDHAAKMLNEYKDYFIKNGQPVYSNPAPGNYEGGISSLEDKSLGCVQKGGVAPISDVLDYAHQIRTRGFSLLGGPGSDLVSATNLTAAGAHIVMFSTGRGTPYSTAAPTVKLSTNTQMYRKKSSWIDFNAGRIADGELSIREAAEELYQLVLKIASGEVKTRGEEMGYRKIAIFKNGVIV